MTGGPPVALHLLPFARKLIRHLAWCGIPDQRYPCEPAEQLDLSGAKLRGVNLNHADLRDADLRGAGLRGADLSGAKLRDADLRNADLRDAKLSYADLRNADLSYANLRHANLSYADLSDAKLRDADLRGTSLDPASPVPTCSSADLASAGLIVRVIDGEEWIEGVRSRRSLHVGATDYSEPGEYVAPYLSVDAATECHPGIYLGGSERTLDPVPARCRRNEAVFVSASKGVRTRRLVRDPEAARC